jgi:hypothetical protein
MKLKIIYLLWTCLTLPQKRYRTVTLIGFNLCSCECQLNFLYLKESCKTHTSNKVMCKINNTRMRGSKLLINS